MALSEGYELKKVFRVHSDDTAKAVGSGGLNVLATPTLAVWVEEAAYSLLQLNINEELTSVGVKLNINHIAPTPESMKVTLKITVKEIDRQRYVFEFSASDSVQLVATGIHERVVVNKRKFMKKVENKKNGSK